MPGTNPFRARKSLQCGELLPQCQELNSVPQYYNCLSLNRESGSLLDSLLCLLPICPLNKHVLIPSWHPIFINWWSFVSLLESLIAGTWSSASTSLLYCWRHWAGKRKDEIREKDRTIDLLAALSELSSPKQMNTENHSGSRSEKRSCRMPSPKGDIFFHNSLSRGKAEMFFHLLLHI